jgi:SP family sugar porter-like MFS transporter
MINVTKKNIAYLPTISPVSAMRGLLFGYGCVVIGVAKPFYEVFFDKEKVWKNIEQE